MRLPAGFLGGLALALGLVRLADTTANGLSDAVLVVAAAIGVIAVVALNLRPPPPPLDGPPCPRALEAMASRLSGRRT